MQYCPDSYIAPSVGPGDNSTGLKYYHVPSKDLAYFYGKVIYSILSGMAHGKSITTELRNLPSEPMGTIYLETAGTVGRFRANGTTFAWDAQGLIAGCDAMLDGGAGKLTGASGVDWFPLQVPSANLQTVTPTTNASPALANTITTPSGFDPAAPGGIWSSLGTAGVTSDVYAAELTVASVVDAVPETVKRESVSRSLTWLLSVPYDATPVTVSLVSVAVSYGTFTSFTATTVPGASWVTSVTLFIPGVRTDGKGYNSGVAWVTPTTTFTPGGITNSPNNGVAWVTPATTFTPGQRFNGVGLNLGVAWVTPITTFTPGTKSSALLLHMDGSNLSTNFTDNGVNALTITANGNTKISTAQSKFGGASGLFDGSGDYLSVASASALNISGDFTIELWANPNNNNDMILLSSSTDTNVQIFRLNEGGAGTLSCYVRGPMDYGTQVFTPSPASITVGAQQHLAISRSGSNTRLFKDGTQIGSTNTSWTGSFSINVIGKFFFEGSPYGYDYNGYIDELRVINGTALYTANFTPPTGPFPNS